MKPDLAQLVAKWQRDLRLLDWRLQVEYVRNLTARDGAPVYGLCSPHVDAKRARIQIRDPETPYSSDDPSVEETLIHELLHLHFAPLAGASSAEIAAEEQAVWAITEAIAQKGSGREAQMIARAMSARARGVSAARRQERRQGMDFAIFLAALRAAAEAQDPKAAIQALIAEVDKAAGGGEGAPAAAQEAPSQEEEKPPMQRPAAAARAATTGVSRAEFERMQTELLVDRHGGHLSEPQRTFALGLGPEQARAYLATVQPQAPAGVVQAGGQRAAVAGSIVSRAEFERFRTETLLNQQGGHLSEAQRTFAATLPYDQARAYLGTVPADGGTPAQRRSSPTSGERGQRAADPSIDIVDRRMGIKPADQPSVVIDPLTRRLSISALQPLRMHVAGDGKAK